MQFVESSVVGFIEVDCSSPLEFDLLVGRSDFGANRPGDLHLLAVSIPARYWGRGQEAALRGVAAISGNVAADELATEARVPWQELPGASRVSADLPRLEQDLDTALEQLRREMENLPHCTSS